MIVADDITIYHNPVCGTSRNTVVLICHGGTEPQRGAFSKEDGELVVNAEGQRVVSPVPDRTASGL